MSISNKLKKVVDQDDRFIFSGRQIVKARSYTRERPAWTKNDKKIQEILLRAFPRLAEDVKQREAAGRWATVIHLYFRMGYTRGQIADELDSTTERVKGVIRSIYRVAGGRRADGKGPLKRIKKTPSCP